MIWYGALALSIVIIIIGVNRKLNMGLVMLAAALALLAASGAAWPTVFRAAQSTLAERGTRVLLVCVLLLSVLGSLLKQTGALQSMIDHLERLLGDLRLLTAALPALIGTLTVPGGAIFSAPLVEQAGGKAGLDAGRQAAANLWFRHALYFAYPLFPSVILASELSGLGVLTFVRYNLFPSATALAAAYMIIFRGLSGKKESAILTVNSTAERTLNRNLAGFFSSVAPILLVLLLVLLFNLSFPLALTAGCLLALAGGIPLTAGFAATLWERIKKMLLPALKLDLVLVVWGIMFFKQALEHSGVTGQMAGAMVNLGLPFLLQMFLFPVLTGLLTGDNAAAVAIVFPLFLPLLARESALYPAYVSFIYFSSAFGHIFTPIHPCMSLNSAYFKVKPAGALRPLLGPAAATLLAAWLQIILMTLLWAN